MPISIGGSGPITGVTSINTTVSDTELGYLDGVSSALQTQINAKAADSSQGLYLITPSSIANSGGSASASGGAVTFSAVSSLSLNGVFTSSYENYRIMCSFVSSTGNGINARLRASGSDITGNFYYLQRLIANTTNVTATRPVNPDTYFGGFFQGTTTRNNFVIDLFEPQVTQKTSLVGQGLLGNPDLYLYSGFYDATTSADGLTFYTTTGTWTGTVRVYGYKN